jgi:hypothetical protein
MKITLKNNDEKLKNAYHDTKADIGNLFGWFECELEKNPTSLNWGHLGSLEHVRANLIETLSFISGISEDMITDSLAEAQTESENYPQKGNQPCISPK